MRTSLNSLSLVDLQKRVATFRDERGWKNYHNPKNLVISILIEAAELAEHFQWETTEEIERGVNRAGVKDREEMQKIGAELSDVLWYCLSLADRLGIDMTDAFLKKFVHNLKKFPKDKASDVEFIRKQREKYRRLGK